MKEKVNALRKLAYRADVRAVARFLRISGFLRKCYYGLAAPPDGILKVQTSGITVQFHIRTPDDLRMLEGCFYGTSERKFLNALLSTLQPGDVVFDIGSNIGQFTLPLANAVGKSGEVIAFEPEGHSYEQLLENMEVNGLTNVRAFRKALGEKSGEGRLFLGGVSMSSLVRPYGPPSGSEVVDVVQGDEFRKAENLPVPRAVKIDVEGYEYFVLRGLQATLAEPGCELLCCEIHPDVLPPQIKVEALVELVKSFGFSRIEMHPRKTQIHMIASKGAAGHGPG